MRSPTPALAGGAVPGAEAEENIPKGRSLLFSFILMLNRTPPSKRPRNVLEGRRLRESHSPTEWGSSSPVPVRPVAVPCSPSSPLVPGIRPLDAGSKARESHKSPGNCRLCPVPPRPRGRTALSEVAGSVPKARSSFALHRLPGRWRSRVHSPGPQTLPHGSPAGRLPAPRLP